MPKIDFGKTRKEAYKALNERSIKKNEDIVRNLAPTTFFVSKEHTQKDILVDYLNHTTISFDRLKREKGFIQTSYHWNYVILNANSVVKNMMIAMIILKLIVILLMLVKINILFLTIVCIIELLLN